VATTAFNKLLELNHRHSSRRFSTACYLLERSVGKIIKRDGMESIQKFAMTNQLRFFRQKKLNQSINFSDVSQSVSKRGDDIFTNVLGPGIVTRQQYHSAFAPSQIFSSNGDSAKPQNMTASVVPMTIGKSPIVSVQLNNTTFSPSKMINGNYDSQMEQYGRQMGFGAVPNHVEKKTTSKKRNTSRSTSQKRFMHK
jgi:hypothetical protein